MFRHTAFFAICPLPIRIVFWQGAQDFYKDRVLGVEKIPMMGLDTLALPSKTTHPLGWDS